MTKQQIKDYKRVQSLTYLKMWIDDGNPDSVTDDELEKLPLKYAISDIDYLADNLLADNDNSDKQQLKRAKWFLKKYAK